LLLKVCGGEKEVDKQGAVKEVLVSFGPTQSPQPTS
jgi:hypothetical protein